MMDPENAEQGVQYSNAHTKQNHERPTSEREAGNAPGCAPVASVAVHRTVALFFVRELTEAVGFGLQITAHQRGL